MEAGLPPATGVALGFDRLVMLAAGKKKIAEVMTLHSIERSHFFIPGPRRYGGECFKGEM